MRGHLGQLGHAGVGPAQNNPLGVRHANIHMHRFLPKFVVKLHLFCRQRGHSKAVGSGPHANVSLHVLHAGCFIFGGLLQQRLVGILQQGLFDVLLQQVDEGAAAGAVNLLYQSAGQLRRFAV